MSTFVTRIILPGFGMFVVDIDADRKSQEEFFYYQEFMNDENMMFVNEEK